MANIQATDIADLVSTTLNELGRGKFTDLSSDYQNTIALKRLVRKNKMTFDGGTEFEFNVMFDVNSSSRWVPLAAPDVVDIPNVMTKGKVGYRHITWNWGLEGREIAMNSGASKIVDLIKTRRIAAMGGAIIAFETAFWRVPAATDVLTMFGLPYYVVKSATANTTNTGFNGGLPSGYSTVANLSTTTLPRWKNYAGPYTAVSKDDLIRKMRHMATYTKFMPLVDGTPQYDLGDDFGYYTNYAVVGALEEILESQNENLGNDIAPKDGAVTFRRTPLTFVKELDLDTTNPIYQLNWGELGMVGLRGWWMKETQIPVQSGQHTLSATHTDCSLNLLCRNRRKQGVLSTGTSMSY